MGTKALRKFRSRAGEVAWRGSLLFEEHRPWAADAPPAALLAGVLAELAQAAAALGRLEPELPLEGLLEGGPEPGLEAGGEQVDPLMALGVCFSRLAISAVGAAARLHPAAGERPLVEVKDLLLAALDGDAAAWRRELPAGKWAELGPGFWLRGVTSLLYGAAEPVAVAHACGCGAAGDFEDLGEDELLAAAAAGLAQAATMAALAAEWCEEAARSEPPSLLSGNSVKARARRPIR